MHAAFEVRAGKSGANGELLAAHWLGEKAEKLSVPPGGRMQAPASASSLEPMRTSPKPPAKKIQLSSIWSLSVSPSSSTLAPKVSPLSSVVCP